MVPAPAARVETMKLSPFSIFLIVMIAIVLIAYIGGLFWAEKLQG